MLCWAMAVAVLGDGCCCAGALAAPSQRRAFDARLQWPQLCQAMAAAVSGVGWCCAGRWPQLCQAMAAAAPGDGCAYAR